MVAAAGGSSGGGSLRSLSSPSHGRSGASGAVISSRKWIWQRWWRLRADPAAAAPSVPSRFPPTADPAVVATLAAATGGSGGGGSLCPFSPPSHSRFGGGGNVSGSHEWIWWRPRVDPWRPRGWICCGREVRGRGGGGGGGERRRGRTRDLCWGGGQVRIRTGDVALGSVFERTDNLWYTDTYSIL